MIERIVQIEASDYDALMEKANMNDAKIRELAEKYYQERGVFRVDISTQIVDSRTHVASRTTVYSFENGLHKWDDLQSIVSEDFRRRLSSKLQKYVDGLFKSKYGDVFELINSLNAEINHLRYIKWICYTIAFSGWGVATMCLLLR